MLKVTAVHRSLQLEGLNLECGAAGHEEEEEEEEEERDEAGNCINNLKEKEEDDYDDDEDELAREAIDNYFGLLHPYYCEEEDTGSGDSCETESQEDDDGGDRRGVEAGDTGGVSEVRLRHPRRLSHGRGMRDEASRRELLQQMLATKSLLEKKQKNRRSGAGAWVVTAGEVVNEYDRAQHEAQQLALRKAVILRQRKNSTAIKMATLERQQSSKKKKKKKGEDDVSEQLEAFRRRLSSLDSQLRESEQDTERTLLDLENRRNQELHLIKDLGGVEQGLEGGLGGVPLGCSGEERPMVKHSHGGSLIGSLSSIPSIVISSSEKTEKKAPEKIFGFKVGGREGRLKSRNPLHFLDLKLRVSRRHKSTESLNPRSNPHPALNTPHRSHSSTPANGSCSDNSSDDELQQQQQQQQQQRQLQGGTGQKTEVSTEALHEIEAFKQLIERYFSTHPRHDSITAREIIL